MSNAASARIERQLRDVVSTATSRESAKVIAFKTGARLRTVQGWQNGEHLPGVPYFFALAEMFPEIREKSLEWLAASMGVDPADQARVLHEISRLVLKLNK